MFVSISCETTGPREPSEEPPKGAQRRRRWLAAYRRWFRFRPSSVTVWILGDENAHDCLRTASAIASLAKRGVIKLTVYAGGVWEWQGPISGRETREHKLRMKAALASLEEARRSA